MGKDRWNVDKERRKAMEEKEGYEDLAGISSNQAVVAAITVPPWRRFHVDAGGTEKRGVL